MTRALRFLSPEQIIALHDTLLGATGGRGGGGSRGAAYEGVDAAAQAVKNSYDETLGGLAVAYAGVYRPGTCLREQAHRSGSDADVHPCERRTHCDLGRASMSYVRWLAAPQ